VTPSGSTPIQTNSCGGSGLPAQARYNNGTPFVLPGGASGAPSAPTGLVIR
jgi:hypothetical protein